MAVHLTTGYPLKQGSTEAQIANLQQVVTSLIDELGHILYNLDSGNVLESATVKHLKAGSVTAEAISQEYRAEVKNEIDGSAEKITQEFKVADGELSSKIDNAKTELNGEITKNSTFIKQNANNILIHAEQIKDNETNISSVKLMADGIQAQVSELEDDTAQKFTEVDITAEGITSRVADLETFKESRFTQTVDGFELDGDRSVFTGAIALTDNTKTGRFAIYHDESNPDEPKVYLKNTTTERADVIIGEGSDSLETNVYIGSNVNTQRVATQGWVKKYVKDNAVAVYG